MIFSIILILFVLVVAFFHYLQGFLSATISCILCVVSVLLAFSYYEPAVKAMSPGKFADTAHAMMLVVLFAVIYLVLRILFDKLIPGNVRVPAIVDKLGGGIMGLITGCLAVGLIAVAAQAMPFGPSIGGYARYRVKEESKLLVPLDGGTRDRVIYDEFAERTFDHSTEHQNLIVPIDDIVVGLVGHVSNGSAAGGQPFKKIHPDYLQELFGQRVGMEQGAKRSAQPVAGNETVDVEGVYFYAGAVPQTDAELDAVRRRTDDKLAPTLPQDEDIKLVVRVKFKTDASDDDRMVRASTGAVRLVVKLRDGSYRQYFPLGTVENGKTLFVNKPDDFLFIPSEKAADFLFKIPNDSLGVASLPGKLPDNSEIFVEAKRYGRVSLAGKEVDHLKASPDVQVLRKKGVLTQVENANPDTAKQKLVGTWTGQTKEGTGITMTIEPNGQWVTKVDVGGQPVAVEGTWVVVPGAGPGITLQQTRTSGNRETQKFRYEIKGADSMDVTDQNGVKTSLTRQK